MKKGLLLLVCIISLISIILGSLYLSRKEEFGIETAMSIFSGICGGGGDEPPKKPDNWKQKSNCESSFILNLFNSNNKRKCRFQKKDQIIGHVSDKKDNINKDYTSQAQETWENDMYDIVNDIHIWLHDNYPNMEPHVPTYEEAIAYFNRFANDYGDQNADYGDQDADYLSEIEILFSHAIEHLPPRMF